MTSASSDHLHPANQRYPRNQWYVAAFSDEVGRNLISRTFLDVPVVLYRLEDGRVAALHDQCPHRSLPLSQGTLDKNIIRCGYHGMEFDPSGKCAHIPQQEMIPPRMCVQSFPVVEKWQWIWIWMGDPARADPALIPDHHWLGLERPGYKPQPFFRMEMAANYQYMHDNLLDTSHFTYLHAGLLDAGGLARSEFWVKDDGRTIELGREMSDFRAPEQVAGYFKIKADYSYHRRMVVYTYLPSINIGKQTITDPANPQEPPHELYAINALTPISKGAMHVFHVQVTSYDTQWTPEIKEGVKYIVMQDKIALEALQARYNQFGASVECSVKSDQAGMKSRRMIAAMVDAELAQPAAAMA